MHFECDDWDIVGYPGEFVYGDDMYVPDYYMEERWLPIVEFPGYWVSNKERVYGCSSTSRRRPHILAMHINRGYRCVYLYRNGRPYRRTVHDLMGRAFYSNPDHLPLIRHLNDIPTDNDMDNLAWGTHWDNMQDSIRNGTAVCLRQRIPIKAIDLMTGEDYVFESQCEAARQLHLDQGNIGSVLRGKCNQTHGYAFEYLDGREKRKRPETSKIRYGKVQSTNLQTGETKLFNSQTDAANMLGVERRLVNAVLKGRRHQTGGYSFNYVLERD